MNIPSLQWPFKDEVHIVAKSGFGKGLRGVTNRSRDLWFVTLTPLLCKQMV